jgi:hypothetical protein
MFVFCGRLANFRKEKEKIGDDLLQIFNHPLIFLAKH